MTAHASCPPVTIRHLAHTAGSNSGGLYTLHCQAALQRYACVRAHESNIHDMRPTGDGILSLSSDRWRYHSAGGVPKLTFMDSQVRQHYILQVLLPGTPSVAAYRLIRDNSQLLLDLVSLQVTDLAACEFEPGSAARVMLGRESGGMIIYDLEAQKSAAKVPLCCWFSWTKRVEQCTQTFLAVLAKPSTTCLVCINLPHIALCRHLLRYFLIMLH